nr:hypothetical protein CFP56_43152 [Quercus suber]
MSSVCGKRLSNCYPYLAESGRVFATGLNDFGQLGISENKSYSLILQKRSSIGVGGFSFVGVGFDSSSRGVFAFWHGISFFRKFAQVHLQLLLIVGSFKQKLNKKFKRRHSTESSSSAIIPSPSDLVRVPIHMAKLTDGDDSCTTPTSSLVDPIQGGAVGVLVVRQNMNPASLHSVSPDTFQTMSDQITSPDVNASIP